MDSTIDTTDIHYRMEHEQKIKCPKCQDQPVMEKQTNGKYIIDRCPSCQGIFLDKEETERIDGQGFFSYLRAWFQRK